jgi:hypothetical protein
MADIHACANIENNVNGFYRRETIGKNEVNKLTLNWRRALTVEELPYEKRRRNIAWPTSPSILGSRRASKARYRKSTDQIDRETGNCPGERESFSPFVDDK